MKGFLHPEAPGPDVRLQLLNQKLCLRTAAFFEQFLHAVGEPLKVGHHGLYLLRRGAG